MRFIRFAWPLIFVVPLAPFAGRFCNLLPADPIFHSLVFLHEQLPLVVVILVAASVIATLVKLTRVRRRVRILLALASPSPVRLTSLARTQATLMRMSAPRIVYLDVAEPLCFSTIGGPLIILSRGFVGPLSDDDLTLVLRHELAHVRNQDPLRGVIVHLACGALLVPGFEAIERALYLKRESRADRLAAQLDPETYYSLLCRLTQTASQDLSICRGVAFGTASLYSGDSARRSQNWIRFIPAGIAAALIIGVAASHMFFGLNYDYLLSHHC